MHPRSHRAERKVQGILDEAIKTEINKLLWDYGKVGYPNEVIQGVKEFFENESWMFG